MSRLPEACWTIIRLAEKFILALLRKTKLGNGLTVWEISWQENYLRREDALNVLQSKREHRMKGTEFPFIDNAEPGNLAMEPKDILTPDREALARLGLSDVRARILHSRFSKARERGGVRGVEIVDTDTEMIVCSFGDMGDKNYLDFMSLLKSWGVPIDAANSSAGEPTSRTI